MRSKHQATSAFLAVRELPIFEALVGLVVGQTISSVQKIFSRHSTPPAATFFSSNTSGVCPFICDQDIGIFCSSIIRYIFSEQNNLKYSVS